jgi:hypothetical protein
MKRVLASITYGNVVATLALCLALTGGAAWAANKITSKEIGKGAVKNKNLAKNAVKTKNLAKNAVNSAKLAKGAVKNADIADGSVNFAKLAAGTSVLASATGGPVPVNTSGLTNVPLNPPVSVTAAAGLPLAVNLEARGTLVQSGTEDCEVKVFPTVNGNPLYIGQLIDLSAPEEGPGSPFPNGIPISGATFPVGLTQPGAALAIGVSMIGEGECTSSSRIDQVAVVITQGR